MTGMLRPHACFVALTPDRPRRRQTNTTATSGRHARHAQASRPAYERLLREIYEAGYSFDAKVLNAADYGVPQVRPRLFIVGVPKDSRLPELPEPSHSGMWERRLSGGGTVPHVTTGQALAGVTCEPEPGTSGSIR
jgi:site-specific DNA-cytosine methylase